MWHWHGHATAHCGYHGRSSGGNGLFSACIIQSLATNAQCECIREEPLVSPTTFYSFTALSATSVPCRVLGTAPGCATSGCQALWDGAGVADPARDGSALSAGTEVFFLGGRAGVCLSRPGEVQEVFDSAADGQSLARACVRTE